MTTVRLGSEPTPTVACAPVTSPGDLLDLMPRTLPVLTTVERARSAIRQILNGTDDRLLVIVGPCSVHEREATLEYANRLREVAATLSDNLLIVMRAYVEKPRTTVGWRGLVVNPDPDGPSDPERGLRLARSLMLDITALGVPVATEWLSTAAPAYLSDLVAWGCVGARTVESPIHRQLASSLPMPIGMKNRTDGAVQPAVDAVVAAMGPQEFLGLSSTGAIGLVRSAGNVDCHVVLRGGSGGSNYHPAAVEAARGILTVAGLPPRLLIDCSHGNSAKDHVRQAYVCTEVADQIRTAGRGIRGIMLESFLVPGRQPLVPGRPLVAGQSITDACIGWQMTEQLLTDLAEAAHTRRQHARHIVRLAP